MDIKRTILIVALAIVSYVMVLKWNQDYGQAALPTQNVASSTTTPGLPDTPTGTPAANDDIPRATSDTAAPAEVPVAASKDLIEIKTDVLDLAVDPQGGISRNCACHCIHVAKTTRKFLSSCSITATSGLTWHKAA